MDIHKLSDSPLLIESNGYPYLRIMKWDLQKKAYQRMPNFNPQIKLGLRLFMLQ